MRLTLSYIRKILFIFLFLLSKYESINPSSDKKYVLNVKGNSDKLYFYYITAFIGKEKQIQTFLLDTTSSVTTSPCNLCSSCGDHFNEYYIINQTKSLINKDTSECRILTNVFDNNKFDKDIKIDANSCKFISTLDNEKIFGVYSNNLVSFESIIPEMMNKTEVDEYISKDNEFQIPMGCSLKETGFLMSALADGIIGLNNNVKSFISMMYRKQFIPQNLFSLCLDNEGGYLSLGNIYTKYHICPEIEYIDYNPTKESYEIKTEKIQIKDIEIKSEYISIINSGSTITYFPEQVFNEISYAFFSICSEYNGQCGELKRIEGYGICSDFKNTDIYLNATRYIFPLIKIKFNNYEFIWKPKNYVLNFSFKNKIRACLGIDTEKNLNKIILGTNFMHGYDIIFDRTNFKIGFCEASCGRKTIYKNNSVSIEEEMKKYENEIKNNIKIIKNDKKDEDDINYYNDYHSDDDRKEFIDNTSINTNKIYYKYLIIALVIIFILFIIYFLANNKYYENALSESNNNLVKNNNSTNSAHSEIKDINKMNSLVQKVELIENDNTH
jgi:hypothetical protein